MSVRSKPQWGYDGVHVKVGEPIQSTMLDGLLDRLGIKDEGDERAPVVARLQQIASDYRSGVDQRRGFDPFAEEAGIAMTAAPKRGQRIAALAALAKELKFISNATSVASFESRGEGADWVGAFSRMLREVAAVLAATGGLEKSARPFGLRDPRAIRRLSGRVLRARAYILDLDLDSRLEIIAGLPALRQYERPLRLAEVVGDVLGATEAAKRNLQAQHGPSRDSDLMMAVGELSELWEGAVGAPVTHRPQKRRSDPYGRGLPQSAFGRFAVEFFAAIDDCPKPLETAISNTIAEVIRIRNQLRKEGPPPPPPQGAGGSGLRSLEPKTAPTI